MNAKKVGILEVFADSHYFAVGHADIFEDHTFFRRDPGGIDRLYPVAPPDVLAYGPEAHEAEYYGYFAAL